MAELTKPTTNQPKEDKLSVYEKAVLAEMERRANEGDTLVANALKSADKNIHDCWRYVTAQAKKKAVSGCAMIEDAVVFGWAHHYYIEPKAVIDAEMKTTTKTETKTKPTKATKPKKEERPKETLENTHVPMVRPKDTKEAKRESKKQASNIIVMDMFAGMWDDAEEETETTEQAEEEIDDLPM